MTACTCTRGRKISFLLEGKCHNPETAWDCHTHTYRSKLSKSPGECTVNDTNLCKLVGIYKQQGFYTACLVDQSNSHTNFFKYETAHNQASRPRGLMQISLASTFLSLEHFYNLKGVGPLAGFQRLLTWKCAAGK